MSHLNVLFVYGIVMFGIWVSRETLGAGTNKAIVVRKLLALGPASQMPTCAKAAIGIDTSFFDGSVRRSVCEEMQTDCVIQCVRENFNHRSNTLSDEDPGDTKVFAVMEDGKNEMNEKHMVGFQCKAKVKEGSKSFVVVSFMDSPTVMRYVAYVAREYVLEE